MADEKYIRIKLVRSPIGYRKYQRVTAETLGLRKLQSTVIHRVTPQITGMVNQISHLLLVEEVDTIEGQKADQERAKKRAAGRFVVAVAVPVDNTGDNLTRIEGVGPKMSAALIAAGLDTFQKLADASEASIRSAIENAGMRLAPGISSWSDQAALAAKGEWDELHNLQKQLVGGRRSS